MSYNGWTNYPTWNVHLWLTNEEGSYRTVLSMAEERYQDNPTDKDAAVADLAQDLESLIDTDNPINSASLYSDILGWALRDVDWHEIAFALLEDFDFEEQEEQPDSATA